MKRAKMFFSAIVVLAVVSGALAFKARTAQFKLYTCDFDHDVCVLTDGTHNYQIGVGSVIPDATITNLGQPSGTCEVACPSSGIVGRAE
jgi:hypothetical protein